MARPSSKTEGPDGASPVDGNGAGSGVQTEQGGGSLLGSIGTAVALAFASVALLVSKVWHALTADGTLAAAGRMGLDELGAALKPFPESIQVQESGTIWNPTQGEIGAARQGHHPRGVGHSSFYSSYSHTAGPRESWPSEIAKDHGRADPGLDHGHDQSDGHAL